MGHSDGKSNKSALKRLRESLHQAGIVGGRGRVSKIKNKMKRIEVAKQQQKKLVALKELHNPFEFQVNSKIKTKVVGRKLKSETGRPALSKQAGIENRKKSLLVEWQNRHKSGGLVDRRFGEANPHLTPEEKMLERFTRERQSQFRKGDMFNLEDDEDLTHLGQSLGNMDDFDETGLQSSSDDEDDGTGTIDRQTVARNHFGGFGPEEPTGSGENKSKAEVMKELIAKSKMYKHERQTQREEDEEMRMELDDELQDIRELLMTGVAVEPMEEGRPGPLKGSNTTTNDEDRDADYNRYLKELALERRARATDRLKTEEELLMEEKARLERAERHRLRRMAGEPSDTEVEGSGSDDESNTCRRSRLRSKPTRAPQADDLDGDFAEDYQNGTGQWVPQGLQAPESDVDSDQTLDDDSAEDDSELETSAEEEDDDDGDSGNEVSDSEVDLNTWGSDLESDYAATQKFDQRDVYSDDDNGSNGQSHSTTPRQGDAEVDVKQSAVSSTNQLPYTFPAPESYEDLADLLDGQSLENQATVLQRLRVLYHAQLAPENKQKLRNLFRALYVHIHTLASDGPLPCLATFNLYVRHLTDLAPTYPELLGELALEQLRNFQEELVNRIASQDTRGTFPEATDILQFKLIGQCMSTSDLKHPVITPMQLALAQYLAQYPIRNLREVYCGLMICHQLLDMQHLSRRLLPEVYNYLCLVLHSIFDPSLPSPGSSTSNPRFSSDQFAFPIPTSPAYKLAILRLPFNSSDDSSVDWSSLEYERPSLFQILDGTAFSTKNTNAHRIALLCTTVQLLAKAGQLYATLPNFIELFGPVVDYLRAFPTTQLASSVIDVLQSARTRLMLMLSQCVDQRQPLQMQSHRPVPIASYLPKFEEKYSLDRHYDADRERGQARKLRKLYGKEMRGAIRELRKDTQFLSAEKLQRQKEADAEYKQKIRHIMGTMGSEEGQLRKDEKAAKKKNSKF
ncbi:nucleolar complex protein 14 [Dispira simplex]|nr:nucleolar complex protein 14 [Dispira simplex]